jgi:CRP/FNR family transcriptional regulator, cyclic AMP receptor protein
MVPVEARADNHDGLSESLRREGHVRRFRRGQTLFTEGDRAERVFLIDSGWVMISCMSAEGREIVLGLRGSGDIIGELSTLDGEARSATALAVAEVDAIVASGNVLTQALERPEAARELIGVLATRLRDADRKRLQFATLDTLGRVAERLLELSERFGRPTDDGVAVEMPFSQEQLASWCGGWLGAAAGGVAAVGSPHCISTGRHSLVIHDMRALHGHARRRI